ncbi:hypothetical protein TB2_006642 [Malus domestica]
MKASLAKFPTLNGQSVSYAVLQFPNGTSGEARISRGGGVLNLKECKVKEKSTTKSFYTVMSSIINQYKQITIVVVEVSCFWFQNHCCASFRASLLPLFSGEQRGGRPPSLLCSFAPATNPTHTHPRFAELLFLIDGTLEVGFVDTKNNLFTQTLQTGDLFMFPKGLAHFQYNVDAENPALAISTFGSANARTASFPSTLFATGIDDNVLDVPFKTDMSTIQKLKVGLAPKP